jgi:hypothetical protein
MKLNVFSEIQFEPSDYYELLKRQIDNQSHISFFPNYETSHGIRIEKTVPKVGVYLIYKMIHENYQLLYIGSTDHSIYKRICRYVAAARDTQRYDESHAGGEKHRKVFGDDLENMCIKYIDFKFSSLVDVTMNDLEYYLIEKLQPIFNNENYWKYKFESKIEIIKRVA